MSLISASAFTGKLTIPQLGQPAVVDALNIFIQREEPLFLQAALGYELWEDFMTGLNTAPIDQRWINLRDGVNFQASGLWPPFQWKNGQVWYNRDWYIPQRPNRRQHWVGFNGGTPITGTIGNLGAIMVLIPGSVTVLPDGSMVNGPIPGTSVYTLAALANSQYYIERKPIGTLTSDDVSITNIGQTITLLKPGDKFSVGEVFVLHFITSQQTGTPSVNYESPEAGYVYYQWFRDQASNLSGFGTVKAESENSMPATGMLKMADAFNRMSDNILILWGFLDMTWRTDPTIYASYDRLKIDYNFFKKINKYGF